MPGYKYQSSYVYKEY